MVYWQTMVAKKSVRALHSVNIQVYIYNLHQNKINEVKRHLQIYIGVCTFAYPANKYVL